MSAQAKREYLCAIYGEAEAEGCRREEDPGQAGRLVSDFITEGLVFGGHERERPPDQRVGDRVVVAVEAEVRRLAGADGADEVAGKGVCRQRQQARTFFRQGVGDPTAGGVTGHGALMSGVGELS